MPLEPGDPAPEISAPTQDGTVAPDWAGVSVVYFYPRDDTRGCTVEAQEFQADLDAFREADVAVYGVSTDDAESHADFAEKYDLTFPLLADPDADIAEAFGVGVDRGAAARTTFVVVDGRVQAVYEGVDPDGHAENVLADLHQTGIVEE
jgi:peroxiredoxin Q/BCP